MWVPSELKCVMLSWNDGGAPWPQWNTEVLHWEDTSHSEGTMIFTSPTVTRLLRENSELRKRVEALEWLREVEDAKDAIYWAYNSSEDSWDEYIEIHSCARRTAGLHPLESKKITSGAMGLKEAGV